VLTVVVQPAVVMWPVSKVPSEVQHTFMKSQQGSSLSTTPSVVSSNCQITRSAGHTLPGAREVFAIPIFLLSLFFIIPIFSYLKNVIL
jgi:hypothetical protein